MELSGPGLGMEVQSDSRAQPDQKAIPQEN
jgi:hypothetical protein